MKTISFIFNNWHAWESNGKILLSNEDTKELRQFNNTDECINWLFVNDNKPAARALNQYIKSTK